MGTIKDMGIEIRFQIEDIPTYAKTLSTKYPIIEEAGGAGYVFTGAGDSLAAALAAEYYSDYEARAIDPYDITLNPKLVKDKHLYVISVSGRTTANIQAASLGRKHAKQVTGITANPNSKLAENCDDMIQLEYRRTGTLTPGTNSFTLSLLATLSRIKKLPNLISITDILKRAEEWTPTVSPKEDGTIFFVGAGGQYPLALYGSAKIYETLGWRAQYQRVEQFSHMELFALSKNDTVIAMFSSSKQDERGSKLYTHLKGLGIQTHVLETASSHYVNQALETTIHMQLLAWHLAVKNQLTECSFLTKKDKLKTSDTMIY